MNQIAYCCVVLQMKHNESNNNFGFFFAAAFEFVPFLLHFRVVFHFVTLTSNRPISSDNKKSHRPCLIAPRTANNATTRQQEADFFIVSVCSLFVAKCAKLRRNSGHVFRTFRCSIGITSYQQLALIIPTKNNIYCDLGDCESACRRELLESSLFLLLPRHFVWTNVSILVRGSFARHTIDPEPFSRTSHYAVIIGILECFLLRFRGEMSRS